MREDTIASTIVHCLPNTVPYLELRDRFRDMHFEDEIPNLAKYGTRNGRWRYDSEIMTTIIEAV